jgi:hypothetical protein
VQKPKPNPAGAASKVLAPKGPPNQATKRRSSRVAIDMPVEIFGRVANGKMFREETRTTTVNAHGALLILTTAKEISPSVILINKKTSTEAQCRVIYVKETEKGRVELGLEFVDPQPRFWGIQFPPEDWNNADRKRPASTTK